MVSLNKSYSVLLLQRRIPSQRGIYSLLLGRRKRCGSDLWVRKIAWRKEKATHASVLAQKIPWTRLSTVAARLLLSLLLTCPHLSRIAMPSWHDSGWRSLVPFTAKMQWETVSFVKAQNVLLRLTLTVIATKYLISASREQLVKSNYFVP